MVIIGGAPVIFKSKYQRTVALSSAEVYGTKSMYSGGSMGASFAQGSRS